VRYSLAVSFLIAFLACMLIALVELEILETPDILHFYNETLFLNSNMTEKEI
jgi:hypothetical protein